MPATRSGGLENTASRKGLRSMASERSRSLSRWRPCFQVIISMNITAPIISGNQPPSLTLTMLALKNITSMKKKTAVAPMHSASDIPQA